MNQPNNRKFDDVRMRGFKKRSTVDSALQWLNQHSNLLPEQVVPLQQATGRILAADVASGFNIPGFSRSMMDGYAIVAADSQGASSYNPLSLKVVGKSMPGQGAKVSVVPGTAVRIMTGAPVPEGADTVLPAEKVETHGAQVLVEDSVPQGRNIGRIGEDITEGVTILNKGRMLRPQDIALLASVGIREVAVVRQPRIRVVVTGNELLPTGAAPKGHRIVNSNGPMLESLSTRDGSVVLSSRLVADRPEEIRQALHEECDMMLVSGGTSVGEEDHLPAILAEDGDLAIHGIAMRPSRSTGIGILNKQVTFLLPGNPVSCLCAYEFFAGRMIRSRAGRQSRWPYRSVFLNLKNKLVSMVGRTDYARVRICGDEVEPLAISGAAILSSTTQADGFAIVPADGEGFAPGSTVEVFLYDEYLCI